MSIFINGLGQRVNIDAPYEWGGLRYANLRDPQIRTLCNIYEVPEPTAPEDYEEKFWYKTEQSTAPFVVYTKKSDEQIKEIKKSELMTQIDSLERQAMLPRPTREFMLLNMEMLAAQAGLNPMDNIGYARVKEFDTNITALRTQLDQLG